jgi:fumarylacetoacetase
MAKIFHVKPKIIFWNGFINDWSARDIQKWEYVLRSILAKTCLFNLPWIVTMDALEPFRTGPNKTYPLPYLQQKENIPLTLEVAIQPENAKATVVSKSNFKYLYWSMSQQLTHHTSNGCRVNSGDMMGSGTISGPTEDSFGSMRTLGDGKINKNE